jgi:hypothetical protein
MNAKDRVHYELSWIFWLRRLVRTLYLLIDNKPKQATYNWAIIHYILPYYWLNVNKRWGALWIRLDFWLSNLASTQHLLIYNKPKRATYNWAIVHYILPYYWLNECKRWGALVIRLDFWLSNIASTQHLLIYNKPMRSNYFWAIVHYILPYYWLNVNKR